MGLFVSIATFSKYFTPRGTIQAMGLTWMLKASKGSQSGLTPLYAANSAAGEAYRDMNKIRFVRGLSLS